MKPTIEDTIALAALLHKGQVDKNGVAYIYHPLRVMLSLETEEERIAGVLHDVMEDCDITSKDLRDKGYGDEEIEALEFLTKKPEEEHDYAAFIDRIKSGPSLAIKVKLADLRDNMDPSRRAADSEKTAKRMAKYARACEILKNELAERGVISK